MHRLSNSVDFAAWGAALFSVLGLNTRFHMSRRILATPRTTRTTRSNPHTGSGIEGSGPVGLLPVVAHLSGSHR